LVDDQFIGWIPEFLMYGGNSNTSPLVGSAWHVEGTTTTAPDGFAGDDDWWHRHESLCFNDATYIVKARTSPAPTPGGDDPCWVEAIGPGQND
jgi:hypothetical protein